ncbi:MAG: aminoacetone oxidase family FAD-binding enzyme [Lachnospiraceae bacterium]|nr:aminoacetone oxidase family FAD-binding enzyme [Lachnospiraceae bacterium]
MTELFIIGAGASGMIAAIEASKQALKSGKNIKITMLEHNTVPGKKLLATGNGRCNLTNRQLNINCFRSHDIDSLKECLNGSSADDIISYFNDLGMLCTDKNGYIYPYSCQASTVNDVLLGACISYGVEMVMDAHVISVEKQKSEHKSSGGFIIKTSEGYIDDNGNRKKKRCEYRADKVILACGSKAYSKLGSDGSGYNIAGGLGLKLIEVVPALTGLRCREKTYTLAAGVRTYAEIKLYVDQELMAVDRGELQLTEYGISGIPVFQVSRYASYGIADGCKVSAYIDFMPDIDRATLQSILERNIKNNKDADIYAVLCGMVNSKLVRKLLSDCRMKENMPAKDATEKDLLDIISAIKNHYTVIIGTNDFEQSQVCAGGVKLSEIDENFQSKKLPSLYITGEILDVDGMCGGYNLHWAWLSGIKAGRAVVNEV